MVLAKPSAPKNARTIKLTALLRVKPEHFKLFKQGVAPDYPHRILAARQILDFSMDKKDATIQ
jgi:hypothetical protein